MRPPSYRSRKAESGGNAIGEAEDGRAEDSGVTQPGGADLIDRHNVRALGGQLDFGDLALQRFVAGAFLEGGILGRSADFATGSAFPQVKGVDCGCNHAPDISCPAGE